MYSLSPSMSDQSLDKYPYNDRIYPICWNSLINDILHVGTVNKYNYIHKVSVIDIFASIIDYPFYS